MPDNGTVSIITVNYNQTELCAQLLDSIRLQDYRNVEVILVDNGSNTNPEPFFREQYPEVRFLRSEQNLGFAGGNNLALPSARGEYLFFVNNDAEISPGCIEKLTNFLRRRHDAGIVSPLICYSLEKNSETAPKVQYAGMPRVNRFTGRSGMSGNGERHTGQYDAPFRTGYAHGAAMMVPRKVLEQVGPMSEAFFLYYEEIDWCERMHRAGFGVWVEPQALVLHRESGTLKTMGVAKTFYMTRNRVLFMRRNYKGPSFGVFLLFMTFAAMPKQLFGYLRAREWAQLRAYFRGLRAGFQPVFSQK